MAQLSPARTRLFRVIDCLTISVHAMQVGLQAKAVVPGEPALYGPGLAAPTHLARMAAAGEALAALPPVEVRQWVERGTGSPRAARLVATFDGIEAPADHRLPVTIFRRFFARMLPKAAPASIGALANLGRLCMQVDRDGDMLQDLFKLYIGLGVEIDIVKLGFPVALGHLKAHGRAMSIACGPAPFATGWADFAIIIEKLALWGTKNTGRRDKFTAARALTGDPAVRKLLPRLKQLPPRRIAILGHSMTMSLH